MTVKQNPNQLDIYLKQPDKKPRVKKKKCKTCKEFKPITDFYRAKSTKDGLSIDCKTCFYSIYKKKYKKKTDEEIFNGKIRRCSGINNMTKIKPHYLPATRENFNRNHETKYGISLRCRKCEKNYKIERRYNIPYSQYEEMYENQDGKCLICGKYYKILHVDHNHKTKKVRGLLCIKCNITLGFLEDNDFMKRSIEYLKKYNSEIEYLRGN